MMSRRCVRPTVYLLIALVMTAATTAVMPAAADKTWDPGSAIRGSLENKEIAIAATLNPAHPSTDTLTCEDHDDADHWIDPDHSRGQEEPGKSDDRDEIRPWWWCEGGHVTQGSWTTTWTAPRESGEWGLECAINDLPRAIPPGERGCRDDERHFTGTADRQQNDKDKPRRAARKRADGDTEDGRERRRH